MRRGILLGAIALLVASATGSNAHADQTIKGTDLGLGASVGAPEGASITFVARPFTPMLRLELGPTYSTGFGVMGGATFDPMPWAVGLTATVEGGTVFTTTLPSYIQNAVGSDTPLPKFGYDYANLHLGLEFGSRRHFRFYLHGGESFIHLRTENFQNTVNQNGVTVADPYANLLVPSGKFGFIYEF